MSHVEMKYLVECSDIPVSATNDINTINMKSSELIVVFSRVLGCDLLFRRKAIQK